MQRVEKQEDYLQDLIDRHLLKQRGANVELPYFTLDAAGRITRQDNANTTYVLNTYDTANRITEIQTKNSGATVLSDIQYAYNGVNVTSRTDTDGTVTSFGFDNSDQLTSEVRDNSHSTGYTVGYTYDGNQNRLTKVLNSVTQSYSYDSHDKLTAAGSKSYGYDSSGNCTSVTIGTNVTALTYDDSNRVTGITYPSTATNSFIYNGNGLRVSKTDSAGTSAVVTDGTSPASAVLKDVRAVYTPGISERASGTSKFYHGDALGSTRGITNGSQTVTDAVLYDAFGMTVNRTGTTATPFGFVGAGQYQSDADSGLQLLGHRMYDPSVGRFISQDPIGNGDNWYTYCENSPIVHTDKKGMMTDRQIKDLKDLADQNGWDLEKRGAHDIWKRGFESERVPNNHSKDDGDLFRRVRKKLQKPPQPIITEPIRQVIVAGGEATAIVTVGIIVWEVAKWGIAIIAAPETGGLSLAAAGALP